MNSREKGKRGEREAAKELTRIGLGPARRGQQYSGEEGRDVVHSIEGVHIEVKRTEKLQLYEALAQAEEDAPLDEVPCVMHKRNRKPWVFIVQVDFVKEFADGIREAELAAIKRHKK